ncbi:MAG: hypothetical protein GX868_06825 [Actinobacteria bacterium]|nr:hypothetical protein [Actinomycetota bacterium]
MKRFAAVVASLAIISLSIWFTASRDTAQERGEDGGSGDAGFVLACSADLQALCEDLATLADGLSVTVVAPDATVASYLAGEGPDAWLTAAPWPGILQTRATVAGTPRSLVGADDGLAQQTVDLVVTEGWRSALATRCGDPVDWVCLVDAVGRPAAELGAATNGVFKLGIAQPTGIDGVAALGAALHGWFTSPSVNLAAYDRLDFEDRFAVPLSTLRRNGGNDRDPFNLVVTRPGTYGATLTLGGQRRLTDLADLGRDDLTLRVLALQSTATARLVLVAPTEAARSEAFRRIGRDDIVERAAQHGWSAADDSPAGLPDPALLDLLITKWMDR